jgi:hypothetical protein
MVIKNVLKKETPFEHYLFKDIFSKDELLSIYNFFEDSTGHLTETNQTGKRISSNNRFFITMAHKNIPIIQTIVSSLTTYFENLFKGFKGENLYTRIELIKDQSKFWLEPHVDIPEKKLSMMIYVNPFSLKLPGTLLYTEDLKNNIEVPFLDNTGFYFFPAHNTWHGVKPVEKGPRCAIMANVCSFETDFKLNL